MHTVFVTGGTGYMGGRLITALVGRGHDVHALVRRGSERKLPAADRGLTLIEGNALDASTYLSRVPRGSTFVHLVGVAHPSPAKAAQFAQIDLVGIREAVRAATTAGVGHFVYVSVAQPAPIMQAYIAVKAKGEALVHASGIPATILRPWYVLGPGHRWPYVLIPIYWILEQVPSTRESARRLGLVTLAQMVAALVHAAEHPPAGVRIVTVSQIRGATLDSPTT
ncbi:MAG: NAD(P)H-binding protein [Acidobacteria bacterium]|nr:NAD(P)H-binding protein [Acidobacteriota bacterium]